MLYHQLTEAKQEEYQKINDKFESNAIHDGVLRYRKTMLSLDPSSKRPEKVVIGSFLDAVSKEIANQQKALANGLPLSGNPSAWYGPFLSIKPERLAMIALSFMLREAKQVSSVLCREIGDAVRSEIMLDEIRDMNKQKNPQQKGFSRNESKKLIRNQPKIAKLFKNLTGSNLKWKLAHKISLGAKLVECVNIATGGWAVQVEFIRKNISKAYIVMNDDLVVYLHQYHLDLEALRPIKCPMTCPPEPWGFRDAEGRITSDPTDVIKGGFRILEEDFITGRKEHHNSDLTTRSMAQVFEAVNFIQNTEWRIDKDILGVLEHLMSLNSEEYSNIIPASPTKPVLPPIPTDRAARRLWHQNRISLRAKWYSDTSQRISAIKCIDVAKQFKDYPIFFPHNIDFRGRFYPIASYISPQGNDISKALLRYAEELPLGDYGLGYMIISAAGLAGLDKEPYSKRLEWFTKEWIPILKNQPKFDPFSHKVWVDYESPLQFLQLVWEIQRAINSPDPTKFLSSVSVSVDGSQNGLQHLSALMRDDIGGRSVNLIDSEYPSDLYLDVADNVKIVIDNDCKSDPTGKDSLGNDAPHILWQPQFNNKKRRRAIVKRSVMAYPYGITLRGMSDNLIADGFTDELKGSQYNNSSYLANIIQSAVENTVISAAELMKYLRSISKLLAENGQAMSWTTPFGLPILQKYIYEEMKTIRTCLHFTTFYVPNGRKEINVGAQVRGIVANFIHSLDASHAGYVALDLKDMKVRSVQFIHDSIGTHACYTQDLHRIIRKTFINLHDIDIIGDFVKHLEKQTGIKLPPPPKKGKLNLEEIRKSRWFFS